jgi:hypothetical protein
MRTVYAIMNWKQTAVVALFFLSINVSLAQDEIKKKPNKSNHSANADKHSRSDGNKESNFDSMKEELDNELRDEKISQEEYDAKMKRINAMEPSEAAGEKPKKTRPVDK